MFHKIKYFLLLLILLLITSCSYKIESMLAIKSYYNESLNDISIDQNNYGSLSYNQSSSFISLDDGQHIFNAVASSGNIITKSVTIPSAGYSNNFELLGKNGHKINKYILIIHGNGDLEIKDYSLLGDTLY